jgi:hypothetical protein
MVGGKIGVFNDFVTWVLKVLIFGIGIYSTKFKTLRVLFLVLEGMTCSTKLSKFEALLEVKAFNVFNDLLRKLWFKI